MSGKKVNVTYSIKESNELKKSKTPISKAKSAFPESSTETSKLHDKRPPTKASITKQESHAISSKRVPILPGKNILDEVTRLSWYKKRPPPQWKMKPEEPVWNNNTTCDDRDILLMEQDNEISKFKLRQEKLDSTKIKDPTLSIISEANKKALPLRCPRLRIAPKCSGSIINRGVEAELSQSIKRGQQLHPDNINSNMPQWQIYSDKFMGDDRARPHPPSREIRTGEILQSSIRNRKLTDPATLTGNSRIIVNKAMLAIFKHVVRDEVMAPESSSVEAQTTLV